MLLRKITLLIFLFFALLGSAQITQAACGVWNSNFPIGCYPIGEYEEIAGAVQCGDGTCCSSSDECTPQNDDPFEEGPIVTPVNPITPEEPGENDPPQCGGTTYGECFENEECVVTEHFTNNVNIYNCQPIAETPQTPAQILDPSDNGWPITQDEEDEIIRDNCGTFTSYDLNGTCMNAYKPSGEQEINPFVSCAPYGNSQTCCTTALHCQLAYDDVIDITPDPDEELSSQSCGEFRTSGYLRQCFGSDGKPIANPIACPQENGFPNQCCTEVDLCEEREIIEATNSDDSPMGKPFDYGKQVPHAQRSSCQDCMGAWDDDEKKYANEGEKIYTAVGCVSVSGEELAADLIKLLLGIGGGVALLSMLAAAFRFTISKGDSGQIKEAKELITASVSGLLFIIFSVIILQFIGVQILKIPGLG